jgi:hypothetical protein
MTFIIKVNTFMGRPPGRIQHRPFQMRVSDEFLKSVDKWRLVQAGRPSRAKAIRQLVELGLLFRKESPKTKASGVPSRARI